MAEYVIENPDGSKTCFKDFTAYFITEMINYHNEAIKSLRNDYMTFKSISRTSKHSEMYEELFKTIIEAGNYHKTKIREILHGQFDLS